MEMCSQTRGRSKTWNSGRQPVAQMGRAGFSVCLAAGRSWSGLPLTRSSHLARTSRGLSKLPRLSGRWRELADPLSLEGR